MSELGSLDNGYLLAFFSASIGVIATWIVGRILNKRGIFSYSVIHNKIGVSTEDSIFGNVSVTWNDRPVQHLYFSTIELANESLNDYENIIITAYTADTSLLTESTQILDTPNIFEWTETYKNRLHTEPGQSLSNEQLAIYFGQREYLIPVFNRGQVVRISYLNEAVSDEVPNVWLAATVKGVKIKYQAQQQQILGVSQPQAATVGIILGIIGLFPLVYLVPNIWIVAVIALFYGYIAVIPAAYFIKITRKIRDAVGN